MKRIIFSYLNGLNQFYRRNDDAEMYIIGIFILMEWVLYVCISAIFGLHVPIAEEFGNEWLVKLVVGIALWVINKYILESNYREYEPLPKDITLLITFAYFAITLIFLFVNISQRN